MLSGDRVGLTRLAAELGIERFFAEVLPQEKARIGELPGGGGRCVLWVMGSTM
ncbi:MAG: hypothetical protein R3F65_21525 [bacterium]